MKSIYKSKYRTDRNFDLLFVNNKFKGVYVDKKKNKVKVSKIFKWFGEDFYKNYNNTKFMLRSGKENATLGFISQYITEDEKNYVLNGDYKLSYLSYDWGLNEITSE